jgi:hypothetical protein
VQLSDQPTTTGQAPRDGVLSRVRRHRLVHGLIGDWETTPGKLRVTRLVLVVVILLCGVAGVRAADVRIDATHEIRETIEPLNDQLTTLYRSLADADAVVASGFLTGSAQPGPVAQRYDDDISAAATSLSEARKNADPLTAIRLTDIARQLPVYTGLIERARGHNRQNLPVGVAYLRRASELMQGSILPEAEELQRRQARKLDDAYQQAGSLPVLALLVGAVSLAGLILAQVFLFTRTHRVFNVGLLAATGVVLVGLLWWTVAGLVSNHYLRDSQGHSQAVSDALAPAQIAALQARAIESLALVARYGDASEPDFQTQLELLARENGEGGALGAARTFITDQRGQDLVRAAVAGIAPYQEAHQKVRTLYNSGAYREAVDAAVVGSAAAFAKLGDTLNAAVVHEGNEFDTDINRAENWLRGLVVGTGLLAFAAAIGAMLGIRQRLEEYR